MVKSQVPMPENTPGSLPGLQRKFPKEMCKEILRGDSLPSFLLGAFGCSGPINCQLVGGAVYTSLLASRQET